MSFLSPLESELFKSFAQQPKENAALLISPQIDMEREWCTTPLGAEIFGTILTAAEDDLPISAITIFSKVVMDESQRQHLIELWRDKGNGQPLDRAASALKEQYIIRQANKAIDECQTIVSKHPALYQEQYTALGSILDVLTHEGELYDPTPSAPSLEPRRAITGHWGDAVYDDLLEIRDEDGNYHNGMLNYASIILLGATKMGKSTTMYTLSALGVAQKKQVLYLSNEPTKDDVNWNVCNAMWGLFAGTIDRDEIQARVDKYMKIYPHITKFDSLRRRVHWNRPDITIIDSLDSLGFPQEATRSAPDEQHRLRAVALREMPARYKTMLFIPANGSETMQNQLRTDDISKVNSVKPFGSSWYQSILDFSFAFARDKQDSNTAYIKRVVNRPSGRMGDVWELRYNHRGSFYSGVGRRYGG